MDRRDVIVMLRDREDAAFKAAAKELLEERTRQILRRYTEDLAEAEAVEREALALQADAEGIWTAAAARADKVRGLLYRTLGYRGKRPEQLVRLDATANEARDRVARYRIAVHDASRLVEQARTLGMAPRAAAEKSTSENGGS